MSNDSGLPKGTAHVASSAWPWSLLAQKSKKHPMKPKTEEPSGSIPIHDLLVLGFELHHLWKLMHPFQYNFQLIFCLVEK